MRCRSPHVAVPLVFKTRCRAVGDRSRSSGVPSESRTPYLPLRRRTLWSNELRERILVRARGIEPAPSTVICRSGLIRPSRTPVLARFFELVRVA